MPFALDPNTKNASLQPQNPNSYTQIQMGFQSLAVCPWHFMNRSNASKTSTSYSNLTEQVSMPPNGWIFYIYRVLCLGV